MTTVQSNALLAAVRAADYEASHTNVKPTGQPWKEVHAIPTHLWMAVRSVLEEIEQAAAVLAADVEVCPIALRGV